MKPKKNKSAKRKQPLGMVVVGNVNKKGDLINKAFTPKKYKILKKFIKDKNDKMTPEQRENIKKAGIKYGKQLKKDGLLPNPKPKVGSVYHKKFLKERGLDKKQPKKYYDKLLSNYEKTLDHKIGINKKVQAKQIKKQVDAKSFGSFKVLGKEVFICDIKTILRVGHTSGCIESNKLFTLIDKRIQEFGVMVVSDLLISHRKIKPSNSGYNKTYYDADKKALEYAIKHYPKTPKVFWILALEVIFGQNLSELNFNRLRRIVALLKLNKSVEDFGAKKIVSEYKEKVKWENKFNSEGDTITLKYPKKKLLKQIKDLENSRYKPKVMKTSIVIPLNTKAPKRKGWTKTKNDNSPDSIVVKKNYKVILPPTRNALIQSNKKDDMEKKVLALYPNYKIIKKYEAVTNVSMNGKPRYYQSFTLALKTIKPKVVVTEYRNGKKVTPKKPMKTYSMDELSDRTLGKIGTPERDKAEKDLKAEMKKDRQKAIKKAKATKKK